MAGYFTWQLITAIVIVSLTNDWMTHAHSIREEGVPISRNCHEVQIQGNNLSGWDTPSGLYTIYPFDYCPNRPVKVYCDMDTDGGGWTVIQRREDIQPRENFYRTWMEYALGFGNLEGEFWIGLDVINALTEQSLNVIRFDLADFEGRTRYAIYDFFYVHPRAASYKMEVNGYHGTAGDSFTYHDGMRFTTKDKDVDVDDDRNCANAHKGAWWYHNCFNSHLNGIYHGGANSPIYEGVCWGEWHGQTYSLKRTTMMLRPAEN